LKEERIGPTQAGVIDVLLSSGMLSITAGKDFRFRRTVTPDGIRKEKIHKFVSDGPVAWDHFLYT
jgi:hypothetical protein